MWFLCMLDFDIEKCFLREDVQNILKRITGFDLNKIFREQKIDNVRPPEYKLLTTKQLEEVNIQVTNRNFKMHFIRDPMSSTDCFRHLLKIYLFARY